MIVNLIIGSLMIGSVYGMLALGYSLIYSAPAKPLLPMMSPMVVLTP